MRRLVSPYDGVPEGKTQFVSSSKVVAKLPLQQPVVNAAKDRLIQTFRFLKELNELRNPVPRDLSHSSKLLWIDDWPDHPFVTVRRGDRTGDGDEDANQAPEPLIRVRRANLTRCSAPPEEIVDWLKPGWQDAEREIEVLPLRNFADKDAGTTTVAFEDDVSRASALKVWSAERTKWAEAERPAIVARRLFEDIHALWTSMQREGDTAELVLADGMLNVGIESIDYPV